MRPSATHESLETPNRLGEVSRHGPGPFTTKIVYLLPDGRHSVTTSRRHRKGLAPLVLPEAEIHQHHVTAASAWLHFWAPGRLSWWIALSFMIGSAHFAFGGYLATYPHALSPQLHNPVFINIVFFVGSIFFTAAAYLQLLEAINADFNEDSKKRGTYGVPMRKWHWHGWQPRNLGFLASLVQLVGTILFNFNTADAMISGLNWVGEDILIWTPNMLGCICFLIASYFALMEVCHKHLSFAPSDISWWIAMINLAGSIAFQVSALYSFVTPTGEGDTALWLASLFTLVGALCFFVGSYLMIPEMFDGEQRKQG